MPHHCTNAPDFDQIAHDAAQWLYAPPKAVQTTVRAEYSHIQRAPDTSAIPSLDYALRLANSFLVPADRDVAQERCAAAYAFIDFDCAKVDRQIQPSQPMSVAFDSPAAGRQVLRVPMPIFARAYDRHSMAAAYDPIAAAGLDASELAHILYLTLASRIDPDEYDDHHSLAADREEAFYDARTYASAIINCDTEQAFVDLLRQQMDHFNPSVPWPTRRTEGTTTDGLIRFTIQPRESG